MRTLVLFALVVALLVAGVGFALPALSNSNAQASGTSISILGTAPVPVMHISCAAGPCDCPTC
jgi:hypothetical protein